MLEEARLRPFERREWVLRQVRKYGRSEAEAELEWEKLELQGYRKDFDGFRGRMRLHLPKGAMEQVSGQKRFIEGAAEETSDKKKKPTLEARDSYRRHVGEFRPSLGHEFFSNQSTLAAQGLENGEELPQEQAEDATAEDDFWDLGMPAPDPSQQSQSTTVNSRRSFNLSSESEEEGRTNKKLKKGAVIGCRTTMFTRSTKDLVRHGLGKVSDH